MICEAGVNVSWADNVVDLTWCNSRKIRVIAVVIRRCVGNIEFCGFLGFGSWSS